MVGQSASPWSGAKVRVAKVRVAKVRVEGMSDASQNSSATPRPVRVLTLGEAGCAPAVIEAVKGAPLGAALSWTPLPDPDQDMSALVRAGAEADVALIGFEAGATALQRIQRWAWLASKLGVSHLVLSVESGDLPPEGRKGFDALLSPLLAFVKARCAFHTVTAVPVDSATAGNVLERDSSLGWYMGPTLIDHVVGCAHGESGDGSQSSKPQALLSDHLQARIFWVGPDPLIPWRPLHMKTTNEKHEATVTRIKYERDAHADQRIARNRLLKGDIGVCNINTTEPFQCISFLEDRGAGLFSLVDPATDAVVGLGLIDYSLRRASNIRWQKTTITAQQRARQKQQKACVLWFTGLSGSGKSTIADIVEQRLNAAGRHTMLLDGDNVRHGLNKDLGFTDVDRVENIRRISEVSKLMCDAGLIVLVSFISPFKAERHLARETVASHDFHEIYVATPLEVAEQRDVKGLYAKARRGEIKNFTGIDSPYEPPERPEMMVDTTTETAEYAAERIIADLLQM